MPPTMQTPIGTQSPAVGDVAARGAQNPSTNGPDPAAAGSDLNSQLEFGILESDKQLTIDTIGNLRGGWMQDRMERIRVWMLSVMMEKGIQWVGWDQSSNTWFDALAEVRNNGGLDDGESVELEKWMNNLTLMFKQVFVGNLTRAIPHSVVRPANAEKPKDTMTAKAAQDVLQILDRKNQVRKLMRTLFETLYTYGVYFRYTRPVLDGIMNGYDVENVFEDIDIQMPARMKCPGCATETPMTELQMGAGAPGSNNMDDLNPSCPACGDSMPPESYYAEGEGNRTSLQIAGQQKIPRASVRQSIHTPLEIDLDPNVKEWFQSGLLAKDTEISFGEALKMYNKYRDQIKAGGASETTPNADWEKLMRTQVKSVTSGYASDLSQNRPTYSMVWVQPSFFWEAKNDDYAKRMEEKFPEGALIEMIGGVMVGMRPECMRRRWSSARLYESYGPYCPSIAERVVPFNQRLNAAMQMLDDWMQRSSTGLNIMDGARMDPQKADKRALIPGHVFSIPMRINGESRPLSQVFAHYDLPLNPAAWNYPNMLIQMCQMLVLLPPQSFGGGTQEGVDTATGQEQQLGQATAALQPYWENVKDECAEGAYNEIMCVKELMSVGALDKLWTVEETRGAGYRNQMVDWKQMEGEVEVFSDEDQGLPTSPDELRQSFIMLFKELGSGNPAAKEWFEVPENQQMVLSTMIPGSVSPVQPQITKTQIDIQMLVTKAPMPQQDPKTGAISMKLPVEPDKNVEDYTTAKYIVRKYMLEECDLRYSNPMAWENLNGYMDMLEDLDAQIQAEHAARQLKINQAGQPAPQPPPQPDPGALSAVQELQALATQMAQRLSQLALLDPAATGGTANAQVSAANDVVKSAIDASKALHDSTK